jgi:hypothetical protein
MRGQFAGGIFPNSPLLRRGSVDTYPPFFLEDFLSGTDSRRVLQFNP